MIIAVFSCSGKTHFATNHFKNYDLIDCDMYDFAYRGGHGPEWLGLYVERILQVDKKFEYVFINALPEIVELLPNSSIVVYPERELKQEWVYRAIRRGGNTAFPRLLENEWNKWIDACEKFEGKKLVLKAGQYLEDIIEELN